MNEIIQDVLFLVIVFGSNVIQVITGFAGTMLAMPFSIRLLGAEEAKAILNVLGLAASLGICLRNRKSIVRTECIKMSGGMLVGMVLGILLFKKLPLNFLLFGYGVVIILIAVKKMCFSEKEEKKLTLWSSMTILLCAGLLHGMFVSGGALLVVYAAKTLKEKQFFRATLSAVWVLLNSILLAEHIIEGYFQSGTVLLTFLAMAVLGLAFYAGEKIGNQISQKAFLKLTYVLLMLSGISILL